MRGGLVFVVFYSESLAWALPFIGSLLIPVSIDLSLRRSISLEKSLLVYTSEGGPIFSVQRVSPALSQAWPNPLLSGPQNKPQSGAPKLLSCWVRKLTGP